MKRDNRERRRAILSTVVWVEGLRQFIPAPTRGIILVRNRHGNWNWYGGDNWKRPTALPRLVFDRQGGYLGGLKTYPGIPSWRDPEAYIHPIIKTSLTRPCTRCEFVQVYDGPWAAEVDNRPSMCRCRKHSFTSIGEKSTCKDWQLSSVLTDIKAREAERAAAEHTE
ncbi:MAG TPA: hypothetical protein VM537_16530 [Anaerolineae bacterium]|nr:hypothetical protein [Anaerolineae bacterium]